MTQVDFYIIENGTYESAVCRLIEKAYEKKQKVYVHTDAEIDAEKLDELLWTFSDNSFIPHNLISETRSPIPLVRIGYGEFPADHNGTLINLSKFTPEKTSLFTVIIEFVAAHNKDLLRERYKYYRSCNYELTSYKI